MRALLLALGVLAACGQPPMVNVTAHSGVRPTSAFGGSSFAPNPGTGIAAGGTVSGSLTVTGTLLCGLATTSPFSDLLYCATNTADTGIGVQVSSDTNLPADFDFARSRGTYASPTTVTSSSGLGSIYFWGYDGSSFGRAAKIQGRATQGFDGTHHGGSLDFTTTNSTSQAEELGLRVQDDQIQYDRAAVNVQAAACAAGVLALDPTKDVVEIDANGAACVVTLGEANANVGRAVTMVITATPGAGLVTFPDVAGKHLGPTLCTTTGIGLGGTYTVYYAGTVLEYVGKSCEANQ